MQKFHFKLQPLLNRELIYESECVGRMRAIQDKYLKEEDKLKNLGNQKILCQNDLSSKKQHDISPVELRAYEEYFLKLDSDSNSSNIKMQEMTKEYRTAQDELVKIVKKRKALEKLRDKWEEEYKDYLESLSNKEMDDIAMTKFANKLVAKNEKD
ncbi:MAG: flagellar export protein FliJ [Thermodesulfobacteriota bacterium]